MLFNNKKDYNDLHREFASTPQSTGLGINTGETAAKSKRKSSDSLEPVQDILNRSKNTISSQQSSKNKPNSGVLSSVWDKYSSDFHNSLSGKTEKIGATIKNNIKNVLSKKYSDLDTRHLFDGISDKDIENSIPIAENTVKTNLDRGLLSEEKISKLPNLLNGLAVSYAAADKGNNKAATRAREAAYTESNEPLVKSTGTRLLSNDTPYAPRWKSFPEIKSDNTSGSKNEGYVYKPKEEKSSGGGKMFGAQVERGQNNYTANKNPESYQREIISNYYKDGMLDSDEYKHVSDYLNHKTTPMVAYYGRIDKNNDLENSEYSKTEMLKFNAISADELELSKDEHIKRWKKLASNTSWLNPEMTNVLFEMIEHFADGSGTNYTNEVLTQVVKNHSETQRYMKDFTAVFDKQLQLHNGDLTQIADSDEFHTALGDNGVLLSTYSYSGFDDLFGGLEHAIHSWTESEVEISSLEINPDGTYHGELNFVFVDDFGLDDADIVEFGDYAGFRSWFILQHYDNYSDCAPFKTVVKINYPISGKIEGYKNEGTIT